MGTVYLGQAPQDRLVAIKVVRTDLIHDEEFLGRYGDRFESGGAGIGPGGVVRDRRRPGNALEQRFQ
jgi:hypothetical protein